MRGYNKVILIGNLTKDAEVRYLPTGTAAASFTLAINRTYKSQSGEWKEETSFIPVELLGKQAENCKEYLTKGKPVLVEGRLRQRSWNTPEGQKRSMIDVVAFQIKLLGVPQKPLEEPGIAKEELKEEFEVIEEEASLEESNEVPF
jgi:single-strand DNA-binding protein